MLSARHLIIATHYNPDADAWGSLAALMWLLDRVGKTYQAYCRDLPPEERILPGLDQVWADKARLDWARADVVVSLDCGHPNRTGLAEFLEQRRSEQLFIEIDHHLPVESGADLVVRDSRAAATGQVLYDLCQANQLIIDQTLADCLLAGLAGDTANFFYPTTSDRTIRIAADLLRRGGRWPASGDQSRLPALRLWGVALSRLTVNKRWSIAFTVITLADLAATGADDTAVDYLAGFLSNLSGVKAVLLLRESANGLIKGSWRATGAGVNVGVLARYLGGGGHALAAGFVCPGRLSRPGDRWLVL